MNVAVKKIGQTVLVSTTFNITPNSATLADRLQKHTQARRNTEGGDVEL